THTFGAGPYNAVGDVVADITGDAVFIGGGGSALAVVAAGSEIRITGPGVATGPNLMMWVDSTSTSVATNKLQFITIKRPGMFSYMAIAGKATLNINHATLSSANVGDWVTIYAALSETILSSGNDAAYLGTFRITAKGTDVAGPFTSIPNIT